MTTTVTFTLTERKRIHILRELDAKRLTAREAALTCPPIPVPHAMSVPKAVRRWAMFANTSRWGVAQSAIQGFDKEVVVCWIGGNKRVTEILQANEDVGLAG